LRVLRVSRKCRSLVFNYYFTVFIPSGLMRLSPSSEIVHFRQGFDG
jgi:hypothetical protein